MINIYVKTKYYHFLLIIKGINSNYFAKRSAIILEFLEYIKQKINIKMILFGTISYDILENLKLKWRLVEYIIK